MTLGLDYPIIGVVPLRVMSSRVFNWPTWDFDPDTVIFDPGMAIRNTSGPLTKGIMIQGNFDGSGVPDVVSWSRGNQVNGNFYDLIDMYQFSLAKWIIPEKSRDATQTNDEYWLYLSANYWVRYEHDNARIALSVGGQTATANLTTVAGTRYFIVISGNTNNKIDANNYLRVSINDSHTFGATTQPTVGAPDATLYLGSDGDGFPANAIIEGWTLWNRILSDGANGVAADGADEIATIYNAGSGAKPWEIAPTGLVASFPTNGTAGEIVTGAGNMWNWPWGDNELTAVDGLMLGAAWNNWTQEGTPSANGLVDTAEKIFSGGYKFTNDAANEGYYYDIAVSPGDDFDVIGLAHSDGTGVPKLIMYDQTGGAEIGSLTGTNTSTKIAPDVFYFTTEAPAVCNTIRVKCINTQASNVGGGR